MRAERTDNSRLSFEITPRRRRDGFTLNSDKLVFPLWYTTLNGAISYARFLGRDSGCDIRIFNSTGSILEEIAVEGNQLVQTNSKKRSPANRSKRVEIA